MAPFVELHWSSIGDLYWIVIFSFRDQLVNWKTNWKMLDNKLQGSDYHFQVYLVTIHGRIVSDLFIATNFNGVGTYQFGRLCYGIKHMRYYTPVIFELLNLTNLSNMVQKVGYCNETRGIKLFTDILS